jgi:hypothetical protein
MSIFLSFIDPKLSPFKKLVRAAGFEPAAPGSQGRCSAQTELHPDLAFGAAGPFQAAPYAVYPTRDTCTPSDVLCFAGSVPTFAMMRNILINYMKINIFIYRCG